jgi:hypothetical protein
MACPTEPCPATVADARLPQPSWRRFVLEPVDIAFIQRGSGLLAGLLPASATLGRASDGPAAVLLRFELPRDVDLVQANLVFDRARDTLQQVGGDGAGVALHAERIVGPWSGAMATWLDGPELEDPHTAAIVLRRDSPSRVRLDVTSLVKPSSTDAPPDQGLALLAHVSTASGAAIVLVPGMTLPLAGDPGPIGAVPWIRAQGPRLEVYAK